MHTFSEAINLHAGLPLGGYIGDRLSASENNALEVNGFSFNDSVTGNSVEICSIDALYAGDLISAAKRNEGARIFAASHTHYAPMLDSSKPALGVVANEAIDQYARAIDIATRREVAPDVCRIYRAEVPVPIYRRFDVPDTALNRLLTSRAGMYPNSSQNIDRKLYIFEFAREDAALFTMVLHACHPVSRHDPMLLSPDYIGAVRNAVRRRFFSEPCLFLLGCAGDIRPGLARKRISWMPRSRFNWRFEWPVRVESETAVDDAYTAAVNSASLWKTIPLKENTLMVENRKLSLTAVGNVEIPRLSVAGILHFEFVPFEVSHHFHLDAQKKDPMKFIVSCANHTLGYLPHPNQFSAGGYEVDGSRIFMSLAERIEFKAGVPW
ncbi:hypothetical protein [Variovorax sp. Varisp36]|uniref:hypothetical protein n=1 Tax=Variovorax sp. Varisp36 TaxID=3243031 RepID=UPI0039A72E87